MKQKKKNFFFPFHEWILILESCRGDIYVYEE